MAADIKKHQQPSLAALTTWLNQQGITKDQIIQIFKDEYSGQWTVVYEQ